MVKRILIQNDFPKPTDRKTPKGGKKTEKISRNKFFTHLIYAQILSRKWVYFDTNLIDSVLIIDFPINETIDR